jgi:ferredoxin-NADP reductase
MPATEPSYRTPPIPWTVATAIDLTDETPQTRTLVLSIDNWPGHRPGQHLDVRLTAEDGFQQERSYSIASPPEQTEVEITVERIDDGVVSPYLAGDLRIGDQFEVRGPIGGYFVWDTEIGGPALLVGGGSGIVPLMAMVRHRQAQASREDVSLLVSTRSLDRLIYRDELSRLAGEPELTIAVTLTRSTPVGWGGYSGRIDATKLQSLLPADARGLNAFICGPSAFVETAAELLLGCGIASEQIHTERFGPTGT